MTDPKNWSKNAYGVFFATPKPKRKGGKDTQRGNNGSNTKR